MESRNYWEENGTGGVKYENYNSNDEFQRAPEQLNFATAAPLSEDEAEYPTGGYLKKGKVTRQDPMSHRIIEKRRRDRMNNCLADLSRLIPPEYLKKGRGRVEKTEIIEMSIRHIKYLQERTNGLYHAEKNESNYAGGMQVGEIEAGDSYTAGYQAAVTEAIRFLVQVQGYGQSDGLCVQLASHLQRHCEQVTKGKSHETARTPVVSSSENNSSSNYKTKPSVIARVPPPPPEPARCPETYEPSPPELSYAMECEREVISLTIEDTEPQFVEDEPLPLDVRQKQESNLRTVRKPDYTDDYLHSYKFKNSIERRFSRSQDSEVHDMSMQSSASQTQDKVFSHKRRRATKLPISTSTSNSGSTEETTDNSPQDTSSESNHQHNDHHHFEKSELPFQQLVPVFALNTLGKYYVPLSVDYNCLSQHLGPYDVLDTRTSHHASPLHPVTIHVNFQPCLNGHIKREPSNRDWRDF